MTRVARESRDPRTYNQPLPSVTRQEHVAGKVSAAESMDVVYELLVDERVVRT